MFQHILLAVDFSRHSEIALKMAAAICEGKTKHLTVLAVCDPDATLPLEGVFGISERAFEKEEHKLHEEFVVKLKEFCLLLEQMEIQYDGIVEEGSPAKTILETARDRKCDLIVIGSHSRRSILDIGLGGTTTAVVKKAPCPVLVAALPEAEEAPEE